MGREREGMEGREMGMHEKYSQKTQHIWHLGTPLGATAKCHTFLESFFHENGNICLGDKYASILNL